MSVTGSIMAAVGAVGAIGGGAIAAHGAGKAASAQEQAANHAADLQHQDAEEALAFQKKQYEDSVTRSQPWITAGTSALGTLQGLMAPGGDLSKGFTEQFKPPTMSDDPGYQFRLEQGQKALQSSAAAKGGLLSGNTAKALEDYTQNSASNEYSNTYNRSYQQFLDRFNIFNANQTNEYNRYAGLSGLGQTTATQLNNTGLSTGNSISNTLLTSGQQIGNDIQNAAAARASGYVGSANVYSGAVNSGTNSIMDLFLLKQLSGGGDPYGLKSGNYPS